MGAPAKFLFDVDFSEKEGAPRAPSVAEVAARTEEAEHRGYRSGFAAGQAEAHADTQRRLMLSLERIAQSLDVMTTGLIRLEDKLEAEAVEVALATARKLAGALMTREPLAEITDLITECFREVHNAPHLAIRVHDSLYESAKTQIEQIARIHGFEGRLIILAEPDIAAGDCTIEWADGGMVRDRQTVDACIDELVGRYLAARDEHRGPGASPAAS